MLGYAKMVFAAALDMLAAKLITLFHTLNLCCSPRYFFQKASWKGKNQSGLVY